MKKKDPYNKFTPSPNLPTIDEQTESLFSPTGVEGKGPHQFRGRRLPRSKPLDADAEAEKSEKNPLLTPKHKI